MQKLNLNILQEHSELGERTREGNDLYHEMIASGVINIGKEFRLLNLGGQDVRWCTDK